MIKQYIPLSLLAFATFIGSQAMAQDQFTKDFESVRKELVSWDPVRGEWLSSSLVAMTKNQPIPDRMFPEDFTPLEMLKVVPASTRNAIASTAANNSNPNNNRDSVSRQSWNQVAGVLDRAACKPVMGRTYGDPHLSSFDGASYSFQTVGEFVMVKSASRNMEVQARQRSQSDDISLNTAVAMNVAGDRLCIYAQEKPDGNNTTPIRLNGEAIYVVDETYYLEHGGTVRNSGRNNYLITWPTGETVNVDVRGGGTFPFMNIAVQVYPCADTYEGILGNANGRSSDDFDTRGSASRQANLVYRPFGSANDPQSQAMEREYLAFLAKDFAQSWRVTQPTSLFDYGFGQSTFTFTDESFPRVHHTLADLTPDQRDRARRNCEREGITAADMNGCIYDQGFVNIPPTPQPVIADRTTDFVVRPIVNPVPNVNPGVRKPMMEAKPQGVTSPTIEAQPLGTRPTTETNSEGVDSKKQPNTDGTATSGRVDTKNPVEKSPETISSPQVEKPATIQKTPTPVSTPEPAEEPARKGSFGRFLETVSGSGSGNGSGSGSGSGNGSSSGRTTTTSSPQPVSQPSTPAPVQRTEPTPRVSTPTPTPTPAPRVSTPAPAPRVSTPSPAPKTTPTPTRGGR